MSADKHLHVGRSCTAAYLGHGVHTIKHLLSDGVIDTIVAVFDILLCQLPRGGHLMPVRAFGTTLALATHKEGADGCAIPLHTANE